MGDETTVSQSRVIEDNFINTTGLSFPQQYLSYSQMTKFQLCPKAYEFTYIHKMKEIPGPKAMIGIAGHKMLELMAEFEKYDYTLEELQAQFEMAFSNTISDLPADYKKANEEELNEEKDRLIPSMQLYCKDMLPKLNIVAQEVQVHKPIQVFRSFLKDGKPDKKLLGEISVVGFIDFINSTSKIRQKQIKGDTFTKVATELKEVKSLEFGDYKTGSVKDHTHFMGDIQIPFYSYATGIGNCRIDNICSSKVKFNKDGSPRKDNVPPSFNVLKYSPTKEDITDALETMSEFAAGIGSGAYPQCHSSHWLCSEARCGHWYHCRGKKADKYLKKVAVEKYGLHIKA